MYLILRFSVFILYFLEIDLTNGHDYGICFITKGMMLEKLFLKHRNSFCRRLRTRKRKKKKRRQNLSRRNISWKEGFHPLQLPWISLKMISCALSQVSWLKCTYYYHYHYYYWIHNSIIVKSIYFILSRWLVCIGNSSKMDNFHESLILCCFISNCYIYM